MTRRAVRVTFGLLPSVLMVLTFWLSEMRIDLAYDTGYHRGQADVYREWADHIRADRHDREPGRVWVR